VLQIESSITKKLVEAVATRENRLRGRVNDALKGVLTPFAKGSDLDNVVARQGIERLEIPSPVEGQPAQMESDASLLRRYLLSFDIASAGSADRYLYEAWTTWPQNADRSLGLWDARVNGFDVHGRRGDTDVVIIGPFGRLATSSEKAAISAAVRAPHVKPEAVSVAVLDAVRVEYTANLAIETRPGPSPDFVKADVVARIRREADKRMTIGGEIPAGFLAGVAYGDNVITVTDLDPVAIEPDPYSVPVLTEINVIAAVRP